ncbi:MAG: hypothetical protein QM811_30705 [Pirellulales bacterium]
MRFAVEAFDDRLTAAVNAASALATQRPQVSHDDAVNDQHGFTVEYDPSRATLTETAFSAVNGIDIEYALHVRLPFGARYDRIVELGRFRATTIACMNVTAEIRDASELESLIAIHSSVEVVGCPKLKTATLNSAYQAHLERNPRLANVYARELRHVTIADCPALEVASLDSDEDVFGPSRLILLKCGTPKIVSRAKHVGRIRRRYSNNRNEMRYARRMADRKSSVCERRAISDGRSASIVSIRRLATFRATQTTTLLRSCSAAVEF